MNSVQDIELYSEVPLGTELECRLRVAFVAPTVNVAIRYGPARTATFHTAEYRIDVL